MKVGRGWRWEGAHRSGVHAGFRTPQPSRRGIIEGAAKSEQATLGAARSDGLVSLPADVPLGSGRRFAPFVPSDLRPRRPAVARRGTWLAAKKSPAESIREHRP